MKQNKGSSTTPPQPTFSFDLAASKPTIGEHGHTIREDNQNETWCAPGPALASERMGVGLLPARGSQILDHWTGQQ